MAARVIGAGVAKSGSPIVRLMTSRISLSMSKKRRMPDGGMVRTRSARKASAGRRVMLTTASVDRWPAPSVPCRPGLLPRLYAEWEAISFGWERARGIRGEDAGWVVGEIEVDLDAVVRLDGAGHQEPAAAVGLR